MNSNWYKVALKVMHIKYGKNLILKGIPIIFNKKGAEISIGNGVRIKSSFLSNLVGLYSRSIIVTRKSGAYIHIGNHVGLSGATIYARRGIEIGDYTDVGGNVKILDNDFHPIDYKTRNKLTLQKHGGDSDMIPSRPIKIGKNCFLGVNSIILKGTEIGNNCVVGAGSVVSGVFPSDCVIAGNPARIIKKL